MTAEQYLAWEREQPARHEYFRGDVFAMAGGTPRHNALGAAVTIELGGALRGMPCRILSADQRIIAGEQDHYVYADVSVVCGELELHPGTADVLRNPSVVVEVLSKSTEAYDRGLKWEAYRRIPSVQDYLLLSQGAPHVEHYRRDPAGEWRYRVAEAGGSVTLSNSATLDVDAIYAGVFDVAGE